MKKVSKAFMIALCILLALGLICIGVGVVMGGDFGDILTDIAADVYARLQGTSIQVPDIK